MNQHVADMICLVDAYREAVRLNGVDSEEAADAQAHILEEIRYHFNEGQRAEWRP